VHWREAHWFAEVQAAPMALSGAHAPASQWLPTLQSASTAHGARQAATVPLQWPRPHSAAGSVRAGTVAQVPTAPRRLHASHIPPHAPLQHTPSTQKPDAHSLDAPQASPGAFTAVQLPPLQ